MRLMRRHQRVGRYTRLSIHKAVLVTLLKKSHLKHVERKLHVLLIAFGSECSRERKFHVTFAPRSESSREWKFQRTKVPGSESTRERKFHQWYFRSWKRKYVGTKVPVTQNSGRGINVQFQGVDIGQTAGKVSEQMASCRRPTGQDKKRQRRHRAQDKAAMPLKQT